LVGFDFVISRQEFVDSIVWMKIEIRFAESFLP
jgi:hypothetical protein